MVLTLVFLLGGHVCIREAQAAVTLVQKGDPGAGSGTTSVSAFYNVTPTQNNLLIAIVSNKNSSSPPTTPAGWSVAISETTNTPGQVIYYKIAGASEPTNVTVSGYDAANWLIMYLYEYSGIDTSLPLDQTGSSSGTGSSAVSSGSVTTTHGVELLIAALVINNSASFSGWTNSFTEQNDWALTDGGNKVTSGQADRYVANLGTYSTTATSSKSGNWRGQIVTFRAVAECPGGVVTTTADSATGSLRECILFANNNPGTTITFNIPGPGNQSSGPDSWWRISPTGALPTIGSNGTIIDGTTQTTNQGDTNSSGPEIEIDGNGAAFNGLTVTSANNTIKGLIIGGFSRGIWLSGASATGNTVSGNYIGTNFDGTVANGNPYGVYVSGGTQSNTIGGTTASERNIISGNGTGVYIQGSSTSFNMVKGNYIGTKANGLEGLGNNNGIHISSGANSNTIGGTSENERNIISGSLSVYGVRIYGSNFNKVLGNFIGTDVTGMADLGNNQYGVFLYGGSQSNTIGGSVDGARNIISGNNLDGVFIQTPATNANVVQGNYIGTDITGTGALPNTRSGVLIAAGGQLNIIGGTGTNEANTVAFNTGDGIAVSSSGETTVGNQFSANTIFSNGDLGIDLGFNGVGTGGDGANNDKPAPTIDSITPSGYDFTVVATVTPGDTIEFFRANNGAAPAVSPDGSGYGEGYLYLGSCVDGGGGCSGPHISGSDAVADGSVSLTLTSSGLSRGDTVTATATDAVNGTSEFAANVLAPGPLVCQVTSTADSGAGSLRDCIDYANLNPGTIITFDIPDTDPGYQTSGGDNWWRISPGSALPTITANVTIIDGTTQPGYVANSNTAPLALNGNQVIEISGAGLPSGTDGLTVGPTADGTVIRGMTLNRFDGTSPDPASCVVIETGATGVTLAGLYLGTDVMGLSVPGGNFRGILLNGSSSTVGGTAPADRNLVAGNTYSGMLIQGDANVVEGNMFGTDATGMARLSSGSLSFKINFADGTQVGGSAPGATNVIADRVLSISGGSTGTRIQGNLIGVGSDGSTLLGGSSGVSIENSASSNLIGGTLPGEGNTIAGSQNRDGISVTSSGIGNEFHGNSIYENFGLGIDLGDDGVGTGSGANNDKAAPSIASVTPSGSDFIVAVTVTDGDTVEFFRANNTAAPVVNPDPSGFGEGYLYLGSCVDNGACSGPHISAVADANPAAGTIEATLLSSGMSVGDYVSATATDTINNTSEFSTSIMVTDIVIDCDFSDWCNGAGTEYCVDDEGGQDDFGSPTKLDITRFAFESNLNDTFHVLLGFDDVPPQDTTAATLIDVDLDHNIDFALVANLVDGSSSIVELYSCDDTISNGCGGAVLSKTYSSGDFCAGSGPGPWNNDSFLETTLPYSDLGFVSGNIALTTMVSYAAKSLLTSPKDSVFGTTEENYDGRIIYDTGTGAGDESPTAVNLLSFTATGLGSAVLVEWQTAQEINNAGFYLERATSPHGPFVRITDKLIPGLISSVKGKQYTYEDTNVTPGKLYYYKLEDIDVHGKRTWHGPICVDWDGDGMPDDWEVAHGLDPTADDSMLDLDGDGLTNLEEYEFGTDPLNPDTDGDGIPDGEESRKRNPEEITISHTLTKGVQVVDSDETSITLELRTDSFDLETVEAEGEIYQRLRIVDYIHGFTNEVGKPELPMKGIFIDLPEGSSATLEVVDTEAQSHSGYLVYPVPEKVSQGEGDLAHVAELFALDAGAYSTDGWYPQPLAELGASYTFREQQKLQIFFYPLAFNPVTRELVHYKRIRVRLNYEIAPEQPFLNEALVAMRSASSVQSVSSWSPPSTEPAYKVFTVAEGIYRLTRSWLEAKGIDVSGIDLSQVRL